MPRPLSTLLLSLIALPASAVTMDWTPIGDAGNAADTQVMTCCGDSTGTTGYGSVPYAYSIGTYEVTNAQYAEFLNAVAQADPNDLYHTQMSSAFYYGGISRSGDWGSYSYSVIDGRGDMPVHYVSFPSALRFANWMNNGQPIGLAGPGTTEDGAYTITAEGISANTIMRNAVATIVLPTENEWYKAAYYDPSTMSFLAYPAGSNAETSCTTPTAAPNSANCGFAVQDFTKVGSYTGSASPYGTFDQGGNVYEWNETVTSLSSRGVRGGNFTHPAALNLPASIRIDYDPSLGDAKGFRLAMIPEPGTGLLVSAGLVVIAGRRRTHSGDEPLR